MPRSFQSVLFISVLVLSLLGCASDSSETVQESVSEDRVQELVNKEVQAVEARLRADFEAYQQQVQEDAELTTIGLIDSILDLEARFTREFEGMVDLFEETGHSFGSVCLLEYRMLDQNYILTEYVNLSMVYMGTGDKVALDLAVARMEAGMSDQYYNENAEVCVMNSKGELQFKR